MKRLYVGNLPYKTSNDDLKDMFIQVAPSVTSAQVMMDRITGRSRGFAFVEIDNDSEADAAIAEMNGKEMEGRKLTVNEARPREERAPRGASNGNY